MIFFSLFFLMTASYIMKTAFGLATAKKKQNKKEQGNSRWFSLEGSISRNQPVVFLFGEVEGHVTR